MNKEEFDVLRNLNGDYLPHSDPRFSDFISCLEIYIHGHQRFDYTTHVSFTGPDDFVNCQMGNIFEAIGNKPLVTTFSDLSSSQLRSPNRFKKGFRIVYVEKRLRHSEDFERLCSCVRQTYSRKQYNLPIFIIGRSGLVDHQILNRTISLYLPPFQKHVSPFCFGKVDGRVKEAKGLIKGFWDDPSNKNRDWNEKCDRVWLKNQDEALYTPILNIAKAASDLSGDPSFQQNILALAEEIVTSKKHLESILYKEGRILQATKAFIQPEEYIEGTDHFYRGDKLLAYVRKMVNRPRLSLSWISQILESHRIIKDSYRDRFEVDDKEKSKGKEKVKKSVQYHCYQFDEKKLEDSINNYMKGDEYGHYRSL